MQAKALGLTRAIGVSDFNVTHLAGLKGEKPALHQHSMSMKSVRIQFSGATKAIFLCFSILLCLISMEGCMVD